MLNLWYNTYKGGGTMKTNASEICQRAKHLVTIAKEKGLVKSHTVAFKEFPVEKEIHEGKTEKYK